MPLEPTNRPDRPLMRISRRRLLAGAGGLASLALLAGCAEGTRSDAERGKEEDAKRDSVVKELQATETYRIIEGTSGTPPSTPEE
jgi:hypothetical protein